jgi:muconolactone delta-isomerase
MKILALEHELPNATTAQFQQYAKAEALKAWDLHQRGLIRELYFRADQQAAVLILECASTNAAEKILAELPYVRESLITFDVIPLIAYPGFSRLFEEGHSSMEGNG